MFQNNSALNYRKETLKSLCLIIRHKLIFGFFPQIPLVADLPVGLNLQDHPRTYLIYQVDNNLPTFDDEITSEKNIRDYITKRVGKKVV